MSGEQNDASGEEGDVAALCPTASVPSELDELTLKRAQRGDQAACRALVACYQDRVFAFIGRMVGGRDQALVEDLAQETFLEVFRALERFRFLGAARLSTWILTIASRRTIDSFRKSSRQVAVADVPLETTQGGLSADATARQRELAGALVAALSELSPDARATFLLREIHGLSYADIARALSADEGTVKSRLSRARERVFAALEAAQ